MGGSPELGRGPRGDRGRLCAERQAPQAPGPASGQDGDHDRGGDRGRTPSERPHVPLPLVQCGGRRLRHRLEGSPIGARASGIAGDTARRGWGARVRYRPWRRKARASAHQERAAQFAGGASDAPPQAVESYGTYRGPGAAGPHGHAAGLPGRHGARDRTAGLLRAARRGGRHPGGGSARRSAGGALAARGSRPIGPGSAPTVRIGTAPTEDPPASQRDRLAVLAAIPPGQRGSPAIRVRCRPEPRSVNPGPRCGDGRPGRNSAFAPVNAGWRTQLPARARAKRGVAQRR